MIDIDSIQGLLQDIRDKLVNDDYLIEMYGRQQGLSPIDVLIEKEKREMIVDLMGELLNNLNNDDRKFLEMYVIDGRDQYDIARELGVNQSTICRKIENFYKTAQKYASSRIYLLWKEFLLDNPSMKEADTPKEQVGWLCTRLQKVGTPEHRDKDNDPNWKYNKHLKKKVYVTPTECRMIEYINSQFRDDEKVYCGFCNKKCTRKKDNFK